MSLGDNVLIDSAARFYGTNRISLGSNVRVDAFAVLSAGTGGIEIGDYVHVAVGTTLIGDGHIDVKRFANLSSRVAIYSSNDDYLGFGMTNPMVDEEFRKVTIGPVTIGEHVIVGAGSVILPGVTLGTGVAVGALSLVKDDVPPFAIIVGTRGRVIGQRSQNILQLERQFLATRTQSR